MKKKLYLLTIMAVIAAVVAVTAAGCVTDVTIDEIWDLAANIGDNADIHILINEGDVRLYEYETENGAVVEDYCIAPDIAPDIADKLGGSGALTFRTEYFSDGVTTRQGDNVVYTANVIQPANFMGISDAVDARVTIVVNRETKTLVSTTIDYTTAAGRTVTVSATVY